MIRCLLWFIIWALTLFSADISVCYKDGLKINFKGWFGWFSRIINPRNK